MTRLSLPAPVAAVALRRRLRQQADRPAAVYAGDAHGVAILIDDMNDAKGNVRRRPRTLFAKGSCPGPTLRKYDPYNFYGRRQADA